MTLPLIVDVMKPFDEIFVAALALKSSLRSYST